MAPPRRRSQLDQLYSDGSQSRLDPNPGLDEATTDATRRRVAVGRADRVIAKAMRSNDPKMQAWGAEETLKRSQTAGWEGPPAGVTQHGQFDQKDRSSGLERIERGLQMKDETTRPGGPQNAGTQPTRDGLAPSAPSVASPASSDTKDPATSPAPTGESGNGNAVPVNPNGIRKPSFQEIEDAAQERVFGKRGKDGVLVGGEPSYTARDKAVQDQVRQNKIEKFGKDLMGMGSSGKAITSEKLDSVFEYGDSLGITREQASAQIKKGRDTPREKDNPLEIDPKYAYTDEQGLAMTKAGENGKPEKKMTQEAILLAKIKKEFNAGKSPEQQKASEARDAKVLARNNQDKISLDALELEAKHVGEDLSPEEIRARGKEKMALYDSLEKERLNKRDPVIARAEKERGAPVNEPAGKAGAPGSDRALSALAADEIVKARKEITDNSFNGFSGRNNDGDWINDPNQGIMPDQKFLRENADNPQAIKDKIKINIGNRQAIDRAFNSELGGEAKEGVVALTAEEKSNSKNPFQTGKKVGFETDGFRNVKQKALDSTALYSEKLESIDKILTTASKTGYPIWEDKELMADANFRKKAFADPVLKKKIQTHAKQTEERSTQQTSFNNSQRMQKELQGHSDLMTKLLT